MARYMNVNGIGITIEGDQPPYLATNKNADGTYGVETTATGEVTGNYPSFRKAFQAAYRMNHAAGYLTDEDVARDKAAARAYRERRAH